MTKFLLDSGDPQEYREIKELATSKGIELWGSTTNPTWVAKKLTGKKLSQQEAFALQKELILEIVEIVPGPVSAEVYASLTTPAEEMIQQGKDIASWHPRVIVKLPTNLEGFKARTELRKLGICINNTLVFSQQQVFAITLHEKIMRENFGPVKTPWPSFISPFVGRLDDIGQNGMSMVKHSLDMTRKYFEKDLAWMLVASIRNVEQLKAGIDYNSELETIRTSVFRDWLNLTSEQEKNIDTASYFSQFTEIPNWQIPNDLLQIKTIDAFMQALTDKSLDISHQLTDKGIEKFVADWSTIISR